MKVKKPSFIDFVLSLKTNMLEFIRNHPDCTRKELEQIIDVKHRKANLAFILAFKELEREGTIRIARPRDVPFPMTDGETRFYDPDK